MKSRIRTSILLISRDARVIGSVRRTMTGLGHALDVAGSFPEARRVQAAWRYDVVLIQTDAPDTGVQEYLAKGESFNSRPPVIAVAAQGSIGGALRSMRAGARDYICMRQGAEEPLRNALRHVAWGPSEALSRKRAVSAADRLSAGLITSDYRMLEVCEILAAVADSQVTLLIEGESGTGKTCVTRMLHEHSSRRNELFVELNCGALSEPLLESELFGHARGSFTSAYLERRGKFELADGGTILLDEIANASPRLQGKLLRVVDTREFERLGDTRTLRTDVRLVAASNTPLEERVRRGLFRQDLYFRLNRVKLVIPPLRERVGDIVPLARHFLRILGDKHRRPVSDISAEALDRLVHYRWPGNVRELRNVVEHGVLLARDGMIVVDSLPRRVVAKSKGRGESRLASYPATSLRQILARRERECILEALKVSGWNKQDVAAKLRISRSTLYKKLKEHGLRELNDSGGGALSPWPGQS